MRLATFLEDSRDRILAEAIAFARTIPALVNTDENALRDHLPQLLEAISADLRTVQTHAESIDKSRGLLPDAPSETSAQTHGLLRAQRGLTIEQLVAEFRALRSSILRLWAADLEPGRDTLADITRFNEAIDQAITESVQYFAQERERWRQIFLGVLGHDLRGPLSAMSLTVELLRAEPGVPVARTALLQRAVNRMASLLDSLLEYNRASFGQGMALQRSEVDLGEACAEEVQLAEAGSASARVSLRRRGDLTGLFDASRVREALANLVSNAIHHGEPGQPVLVALEGNAQHVRITVENAGTLPNDKIELLFEPLRQGAEGKTGSAQRSNLGLGLFIARQIARAHGGDVRGRCAEGRVHFTIELPR